MESPPWQMLPIMAGHRPFSPTRGEPARIPWGRPAVEPVSVNKQSARVEEQERKKQQLSPSFLKHPHRNCKMQPSLSFPSFLFSVSSSRSLACNSQEVLLQYERMFVIHLSAERKPESSSSRDCAGQLQEPYNYHPCFVFATRYNKVTQNSGGEKKID